ncbi:MAG: phosphatase PAP2 family protein [Brumimicrobium sp.]|nr:phosphatase PAP2 family protein [Brumimicrobium sp.]MCO5269863.1 phosphatase PAP2 family protein [Brumimicrobium sp.]
MIDWIKSIDQYILLLINGAHTPLLDNLMWWISRTTTWFPLYLLLFIIVYKKYSLKSAIWFTIIGLVAVGVTDFTATYLFKYNFMRYRPSHNLNLEGLLHFYEISPSNLYKGGQYGFISGHAANSTVIALMFIQQLRGKIRHIGPLLFIWVFIVCYSRMYLGVHYPTDILAGILWGTLLSLLFHWIYRKIINKLSDRN